MGLILNVRVSGFASMFGAAHWRASAPIADLRARSRVPPPVSVGPTLSRLAASCAASRTWCGQIISLQKYVSTPQHTTYRQEANGCCRRRRRRRRRRRVALCAVRGTWYNLDSKFERPRPANSLLRPIGLFPVSQHLITPRLNSAGGVLRTWMQTTPCAQRTPVRV